MSFNVGAVTTDAFERLTTQAGAVLIAGLTVIGVIQTAAEQDLTRSFLEWMLVQLADPELRTQLTAEELETLETAEQQLNTVIAELPLTLGFSPGVAVLLWLLGFVSALALIVLAIDSFGHERDRLDRRATERLGWKTLQLFLGWIAFSILFGLGLVLFVIPGLLVAIFLVFFAAAIVIDDTAFYTAFKSSYGIVRGNFIGTLGIVLLCLGAFIGLGIVGSALGALFPALLAVLVTDLLSAVGQTFVVALITRAYVEATAEPIAAEPDIGDGVVG